MENKFPSSLMRRKRLYNDLSDFRELSELSDGAFNNRHRYSNFIELSNVSDLRDLSDLSELSDGAKNNPHLYCDF